MLNINGVELELDLMDAEVAEKYEKAIKELDRKEKEKNTEGLSLAQVIRQECAYVFEFFNEVWGEGTDKKVFGGKTNYNECEKAFKDVVDYCKEEIERLKTRTAKYSSNRADRRAN